MREASIILPRFADAVVAEVDTKLLDKFGGFSRQEVTGAWKDDAGKVHWDDNWEWTIAMDDTPDNRGTLSSIAITAGRAAGQQAVYVRYPGGDADIIPVPSKVSPGALWGGPISPPVASLLEHGELAALSPASEGIESFPDPSPLTEDFPESL